MRTFSMRKVKLSMQKKLAVYMLLLAVLLLISLLSGLFLIGQFNGAAKGLYEELDIHMRIFEKDTDNYMDALAGDTILLSRDISAFVDDFLAMRDVSFAELQGNETTIADLQEQMLGDLNQKLLRQSCSGIMMMLDTTVSRDPETAGSTRSGIYLLKSRYDASDDSTLLYCGVASIGKKLGIMPHRKWRLEFQTDLFPNYDQLRSSAGQPLQSSYQLTDLTVLPGTSDGVVLMLVPIMGRDGGYYGMCGYEISADYFMTQHAQPTRLPRLTCLLAPVSEGKPNASAGLHCSGTESYIAPPAGLLQIDGKEGMLQKIDGEGASYVGITKSITVSPGNPPYMLAAMVPRADYDRVIRDDTFKTFLLLLLLLSFAVIGCLILSRQFLLPIIRALNIIKQRTYAENSSKIPEINDLFEYLAELDRQNEETISALRQEKEMAQKEKAQREKEQSLSASKLVIDSDDYEMFRIGLSTLSAAERVIFNYYLEGKGVKEIMVLTDTKESTVRFHNRNIYSKLGVSSLKQLKLFAAVLAQEEKTGYIHNIG